MSDLGRHLNQEDKWPLLEEYRHRHQLDTLVETGIGPGGYGSGMLCGFPTYIVIDCQPGNVALAKAKGFDARLGDSAELLPGVLEEIDGPALFWLDAHKGFTDPEEWPEFPTVRELEALAADPRPHVILIDDLWQMTPDSWSPMKGALPLDEFRAFVDGLGRWVREDRDEIMRLVPM